MENIKYLFLLGMALSLGQLNGSKNQELILVDPAKFTETIDLSNDRPIESPGVIKAAAETNLTLYDQRFAEQSAASSKHQENSQSIQYILPYDNDSNWAPSANHEQQEHPIPLDAYNYTNNFEISKIDTVEQNDTATTEFFKKNITELLLLCKEDKTNKIIKEIQIKSYLHVADHNNENCVYGLPYRHTTVCKNGVVNKNILYDDTQYFQQNITSIENCLKIHQDKCLDQGAPAPLQLYKIIVTLESRQDALCSNYYERTEEVYTFDLFNNTKTKKLAKYSPINVTYLTTRNLTLLALLAGGATMYYTKTSPKDLITKLWSLACATRKAFSKK